MMIMIMMMMTMNCFVYLLIEKSVTSPQSFSPSQTLAMSLVRFKPLQSLSSNFVEEICAVLAIIAPRRHYGNILRFVDSEGFHRCTP